MAGGEFGRSERIKRGQMELDGPVEIPPALFIGLAEELLHVRDKHGQVVPLVANRVQHAFEERAGRKNIVLKARQMGLTTWIAARFLLKTLLVPGTMTVLAAHTREAGENIFRVVQRMYELIPEQYREELPARVRSNVGQMVFANDSEFRVVSAADENAGRGLTIHNLHCSELSRWSGDAQETLAGLKAALVPDGELVMESTPQGAYGCFYTEWCEAEANGVVQHFFPWWLEDSYVAPAVREDSLHDEERALREQHGLTLEQIGFRRGLERSYRGLRAQEFAEDAVQCFLASGLCVFETDALQQRMKEVHRPIATRWNGALEIWFPAVPGRQYVMGVDPAGGGSEGDFSAVQIVDAQTGMQCAELKERVHPRVLAERLETLAREYNHAMIVVERNNHGAAVLAYLEQMDVDIYVGRDGQAGLLTNAVTRPEMISLLSVLLSERPELFYSARLLQECRSFVATESGRAEAAAGAHDDLVMAMCVVQRVVQQLRK